MTVNQLKTIVASGLLLWSVGWVHVQLIAAAEADPEGPQPRILQRRTDLHQTQSWLNQHRNRQPERHARRGERLEDPRDAFQDRWEDRRGDRPDALRERFEGRRGDRREAFRERWDERWGDRPDSLRERFEGRWGDRREAFRDRWDDRRGNRPNSLLERFAGRDDWRSGQGPGPGPGRRVGPEDGPRLRGPQGGGRAVGPPR